MNGEPFRRRRLGQDIRTVPRDVPRYSLTLSGEKEIRWITTTSATTTSSQLTHIDLAAEGAAHDPWFNQTLTTVSDCVVRLAVIDGRLVDWHKHEHEDEFFLVLEGRLELEVEGREPFVLGPRHGVTIPRGIVHRPHALGRTVVLMVEPATVVPTGND